MNTPDQPISELGDREFVRWLYHQFLSRDPDESGEQHYLAELTSGRSRIDLVQSILSSDERKDLGREFVQPGHFFSAIPNQENIRYATTDPKPLRSIGGIDMRVESQLELIESLAPYYRQLPIEDFANRKRLYYYPNGSYPIGDGSILMTLIGHLKPKRLIELGCGNSSCAVREANTIFLNDNLNITSVEPYPELFLSLIPESKRGKTEFIPKTLQDLDLEVFDTLKAGDILFIDTTHVSKAGSDVNRIFFEILPRLKPGISIHVHDVFYPFEYPEKWLLEGRCWNEQYLLQAFLQFNKEFEILLWPQYLIHHQLEKLEAALPMVARGGGCSMWLHKKA